MDRRTKTLFASGLVVALLLAVVVSQLSSNDPDGLEYVAQQEGFADAADDHALEASPLAEYGRGLTGNDTLDTAIAGVLGVIITLAVGYGVFWLARRTARRRDDTANRA